MSKPLSCRALRMGSPGVWYTPALWRHATGACLLLCACLATAQPVSTAPARSLSGSADQARPVLGVEQVIRIVTEHNPQLRAAQRSVDAALAGIEGARALPNPRLEWSQGRQTARLASASAEPLQSWGVSQTLESPGLRSSRIEVARAGARQSEHQVAIVRNELVAQIRLRAYQCLQHQAQVAAAADAVHLLEDIRERVRLRVESGEAARYEIIKADAEIVNARERLQTAQLMAEQAQLDLNRLAAGQLPAQWTLKGDLLEGQDMHSLEQFQQLALQDNPELAALQAEAEQAQALLEQARAQRWPGLELQWRQSRDPQWQQTHLGLSAQLPLLDQRQGPMAQAAAQLQRAQLQLEGRRAQLQQQVLLSRKSLDMARLRMEALSQGVLREAEAALRVAQAAYRYGERGILDVLDAQRVLRSVRADLIEARYDIQAARIALDALIGLHARPAS